MRPWNAATIAASASISRAVSSPRSSSRASSASCGNSRIFTAYSIASPDPPGAGASTPPAIGTTSR